MNPTKDRLVFAVSTLALIPLTSDAAEAIGSLPDALVLATHIAVLALGIAIGWCITWVQVWHARREADRESEAVIRRITAMQSVPLDYVRNKFDSESA